MAPNYFRQKVSGQMGKGGPGSCVRRYLWLTLEPDFELDFSPAGTPGGGRAGGPAIGLASPLVSVSTKGHG